MDNFLKMASPLALVAGMAGFAATGSALAGSPGEHQSQSWTTPTLVQSAPTASAAESYWDDLGQAVQAPEYEYLPPVATAPAEAAPAAPLARPTETYAQKPVASATTSSCPAPAARPCGVPHHGGHVGYNFPIYQQPAYQQPAYQAPVYQPPVPVVRDRIVEKRVFVDRPIERKVYVNRPIYVDRPVYVNRPVPVVQKVAVPVDRPVYVPRPVPVVKHVGVPVDRPVYVERRVPVPVVKHVGVPVDRPVYVNRPVPVPVVKPVPVDRPVYVPQPVAQPAPIYTPPVHTGCALPTVTQPVYEHGCHGGQVGYGGHHGIGTYAAPASATTTLPAAPLGGGYGHVGGWGAQDCCAGFTGGHQFGMSAFGGHSKHAFSQIAEQIAQISARIADGENSGMITPVVAANLRKEIQTVSNELTTARQDGQFEEREIEVVAANVRQLAEQMKVVRQNEKVAEENRKLAEQYARAYGLGGQGITPASLRPQFGAAGAFLPSAQYPALQQALPFAYGGFGGLGGLGGGFTNY